MWQLVRLVNFWYRGGLAAAGLTCAKPCHQESPQNHLVIKEQDVRCCSTMLANAHGHCMCLKASLQTLT